MKSFFSIGFLFLSLYITQALLSSFLKNTPETVYGIKFPYKSAGLSKHDAAAHLLSRFTFGARPGEIDQVAAEGLEKWFKSQLDASLPEDSLLIMLAPFDALQLSNEQ